MTHDPILLKQLADLGLDRKDVPTSAQAWQKHLDTVSENYRELEDARKLVDGAMMAIDRLNEEVYAQKRALDEAALVTISDGSGRINYANELFLTRSGYSLDEVLGKTHGALSSSGHHAKDFIRELWETILRGKTWKGEFKNRAKDGTFYWASTVIVPSLAADHTLLRLIAIQFDITDRKTVEEMLSTQKLKSIANEKMAALGEMAGGIAHEINTPLGAIALYTDLLRDEISGETPDHSLCLAHLKKVSATMEVVNKIIRGLRNFCRDGSNDPFTPEDPSRILHDTLVMTQDVFRRQNIPFRVNNAVSTDSRIICRGVQISQVLVNLIRNALDAIGPLPEKWVALDISETDREVIITVTDSGAGIPEAVAQKIFMPFFTTKPVGKGTGLGLSISRSIMDEHHGSISIDSTHPHTRFVIRLPKVASDYVPLPDQLLTHARNVLVVEDDDTFRELLVEIVAAMGYGIFSARDGFEALEIFFRERIDLVLSDLSMPRMSGAALLSEIRRVASTPVVMVTGDPLAAGSPELKLASGFLAKPLEAAKIRETVRQFMK